jgi:hypothetical protein
MSSLSHDNFAGAAGPNPEEINLYNPEEIDLDGDAHQLDESPPDEQAPASSPQPAAAAAADDDDDVSAAENESMFAEVEIHSFDPAAAARAGARAEDSAEGISPAIASVMQQTSGTKQ